MSSVMKMFSEAGKQRGFKQMFLEDVPSTRGVKIEPFASLQFGSPGLDSTDNHVVKRKTPKL